MQQGRVYLLHQARDAVACNTNLQPFDVSGVAAAPIMHTNADELDNNDIDDDDDIKAVGDIPQQPPHAPLVVNDTNDANKLWGVVTTTLQTRTTTTTSRQLRPMRWKATNPTSIKERENHNAEERAPLKSKPYYTLLMAARRARRGGQQWALIRDKCVSSHQKISATQSPFPRRSGRSSHLGWLP